jgi:hypothetical protein
VIDLRSRTAENFFAARRRRKTPIPTKSPSSILDNLERPGTIRFGVAWRRLKCCQIYDRLRVFEAVVQNGLSPNPYPSACRSAAPLPTVEAQTARGHEVGLLRARADIEEQEAICLGGGDIGMDVDGRTRARAHYKVVTVDVPPKVFA